MTVRRGIPGPRLPPARSVGHRATDEALREHRQAMADLAALPAVALRVIPDVELADGAETPVRHGLGRPPRWIAPSCARPGASLTDGAIVEIRDGDVDRADLVVLKATGFGATITVDVLVL